MQRQYQWALDQIAQDRTVLVYQGVTARKVYHVTRASRIGLRNGVLTVDGVACKGWTVALKG